MHSIQRHKRGVRTERNLPKYESDLLQRHPHCPIKNSVCCLTCSAAPPFQLNCSTQEWQLLQHKVTKHTKQKNAFSGIPSLSRQVIYRPQDYNRGPTDWVHDGYQIFPLVLQDMDPDAPDCQTAMYCNHYPSWEGKAYREGTLRRIAHTDFEILTLLFQRPGGLLTVHLICTRLCAWHKHYCCIPHLLIRVSCVLAMFAIKEVLAACG